MDMQAKKAAIHKQLQETRGEAQRIAAIINALEGQLLLIQEMEQPANRAARRAAKAAKK